MNSRLSGKALRGLKTGSGSSRKRRPSTVGGPRRDRDSKDLRIDELEALNLEFDAQVSDAARHTQQLEAGHEKVRRPRRSRSIMIGEPLS
jgi:hypothetical protein